VPADHPAVCLSGLARPGDLARSARALGLSVVAELCYPDHSAFGARAWNEAVAAAERANAWLVTSRKDAVRLDAARRGRVHVIDVSFEFLDGEEAVMDRIREAIA
jgi:tetraacyldisaccharide-1-P 4'-kinase